MGKIVKLKNKKTGVKVYPVTATSAVVDANSGERLNDALKNKVEEAPMDGAQYVRKNGGWAVAEVSMDANEICRINLKSNQGDADNSSLNGATVNVVNTVTSEVLYNGTWNGSEIQLSIPGATTYKVTVGDVADYKTPDAITIEATAFSSRDLIMTYQTEVVSVTLSSDNGVSVVGQKVTINGKTHTWNGSAITQKVAFGVNYSVSVDGKVGYATPDTQNFIASESLRNVSVVYNENNFGILIQDRSGNLWKPEDWNDSANPNAIVLITDNFRFKIALRDVSDSTMEMYNTHENTFGLTSSLTSETNGLSNTSKLMNVYGSDSTYAAGACFNFRFPDGTTGFLGAVDQWTTVYNNLDEINRCIRIVGGTEIVEGNGSNGYNTSTIHYNTNERYVYFYHVVNNMIGNTTYDSADYNARTRAFGTI